MFDPVQLDVTGGREDFVRPSGRKTETTVVRRRFGNAEARGAFGARPLQHRRVFVPDDRFAFERGHVVVDEPEFPVQPETVAHEIDFGPADASVLRVRQHQKRHNDGGLLADFAANRVHAQRAYRKYQHGVRGRHGARERPVRVSLAEPVRRKTPFVSGDFRRVRFESVFQQTHRRFRPVQRARHGDRLRVHGHYSRGHPTVFVVFLHQVRAIRRQCAAVNARHYQRGRNENFDKPIGHEHIIITGKLRKNHAPNAKAFLIMKKVQNIHSVY